ncbi:hypothetical protein BK026_12695 [Alteromonas sp. V450]|nr:hypothetical protein BK026_12695 [Alteromonas sp. V450]
MSLQRVTPLSPSFKEAKGVALIQSRTLSCMDAAAKPLIQKHRWVYGVFRRAYTHSLSKRHKKSAPKCAFLYLMLLSLD